MFIQFLQHFFVHSNVQAISLRSSFIEPLFYWTVYVVHVCTNWTYILQAWEKFIRGPKYTWAFKITNECAPVQCSENWEEEELNTSKPRHCFSHVIWRNGTDQSPHDEFIRKIKLNAKHRIHAYKLRADRK